MDLRNRLGSRMELIGPERVTATELASELPRAVGLLGAAPPGPIVIATVSDGAMARGALAALAAGRTLLPLDPAAPAREAAPLLEGAGLLLLDPAPAARWPLPPGAPLRVVAPAARPSAWQRLLGRPTPVETFPGCLAELPPAPPRPSAGDDVALLLATSGTTAAPRLVPWTHAALRAQQATLCGALSVDAGARILSLLPLHHIDGLVMGLLLAAHQGATLVRVGPRIVEALPAVLDTVWREAVTHLVLTPTLLALLLRAGEELRDAFGGSSFRMFVSTAAPLPDGVWRRMEQATGRPVVNVYGLTETGNLLFAGPDEATRRIGTVGRPRDCAARLVAPSGEEVAPGEEGELQLKGPSVMRAYADGDSPQVGGWYPTGDLARQDDHGCIRILGRLELPRTVERGATGEPTAPEPDAIAERLFAVAAAVLRTPADRLTHLTRPGDVPGWDSLGHLDLITAIEASFAIEISPRELLRIRTLGDAVALVEARRDG